MNKVQVGFVDSTQLRRRELISKKTNLSHEQLIVQRNSKRKSGLFRLSSKVTRQQQSELDQQLLTDRNPDFLSELGFDSNSEEDEIETQEDIYKEVNSSGQNQLWSNNDFTYWFWTNLT